MAGHWNHPILAQTTVSRFAPAFWSTRSIIQQQNVRTNHRRWYHYPYHSTANSKQATLAKYESAIVGPPVALKVVQKNGDAWCTTGKVWLRVVRVEKK
jgi:hypothetical protein